VVVSKMGDKNKTAKTKPTEMLQETVLAGDILELRREVGNYVSILETL
jgi:hypothetical protein